MTNTSSPLPDMFSVCVFCGSRDGENPAFMAAANELGAIIAQKNWRLVYGAGDVGLMGAVARSCQDAGGAIFGAIPKHLMDKEVGKSDLTEFLLTETMHERKEAMIERADAIVVMPGGPGSLDEFFETLTWQQIGITDKQIYILNLEGYWDKLIDLIAHVSAAGFADASLNSLFKAPTTVAELVGMLEEVAS